MYLNCHTYFSLRYGTLSPEELVQLAASHKVDILVLTDINNSTGILDFIKACRKKNITPIVGIEFRHNNQPLYTGIAINNEGFRELNSFLTHHNLTNKPLPNNAPSFKHCYVVYPFSTHAPEQLNDNEYAGIRHRELNRLISSPFRDRQDKLLVWQPITFRNRAGYELHRHLRAIDNNILLSQLQPYDLALETEWFVAPDKLKAAFNNYPQIIQTTQQLLKNCSINFDFTTVKNKQTFTGSRNDDRLLLKKLTLEGMAYRYGSQNRTARDRVEKELNIINDLGFAAYFLITWDMIRYSLSRGFYHVGRGSGANSVVAYCLKITDVDPIELNLYFERFLNPKRTSQILTLITPGANAKMCRITCSNATAKNTRLYSAPCPPFRANLSSENWEKSMACPRKR